MQGNMKVSDKVKVYFEKQKKWKTALEKLQKELLTLGYTEDVKWGMPTYTMDGKNLVGLSGFKHHFGIWFFQGVFLTDPHGLLLNAQEGKTKGMRQVRFEDVDEVDVDVLRPYFLEAIKNHKEGKKIEVVRERKVLEMPSLLQDALEKQGMDQFEKMSNSKQNEYKEYIASAKRESTKLSRLDKILPMILEGKGLNDKYR